MTIGRYAIVKPLGRGGMGSVYLAHDPVIDRDVAIKLLDASFDPVSRARFAREARAAGRLHHPNIVTIFDVGEHEGQPYIAMEYVPGPTLATLIAQGPPPLRETLRLVADACAGLAYAHRAGVVHLDVKPANLVRHEHGALKILDFGIARVLAPNETRTISLLGTPRYMAPEQLTGTEVDRRSDVYALGCVLYEMVTGKPLFKGSITEMLARPGKRVHVPAADGVPPEVTRMIERAIATDPTERYDDLDELRGELETLRRRLGAGAGSGRGIPQAPAPATARRRSRLPAAAAAGVLALAAALWLWRVDTSEPPRPAAEPVPAVTEVSSPAPSAAPAPAPAAAPRPQPSPPAQAASSGSAVPSTPVPATAPDPRPLVLDAPRDVPQTVVQQQADLPQVTPPPPPPAKVAPPGAVPAAEDAIRAVLRAYEAAYDRRDVATLRRILPTLSPEQLAAVDRTFSGATSYDLTLQVASVSVTGANAIVTSLVTHSFTPKVGSAVRSAAVETRFHLRQNGVDWVIDRIETSGRR
jgi:serine/threonine protein kinase